MSLAATGKLHHLMAISYRLKSIGSGEADVGSYATAGRNGCGWVVRLPAASAPRSIAQ
jgi:hypothetical protein